MSPQSANPVSKSTNWLDFCSYWTYTKRTLEERLEHGDSHIISVVSTVAVTYSGSILNIVWDGTSKIVYHGTTQRTIAERQIITDTLEIQLKRENIIGLDTDQKILRLREYNTILEINPIEQSPYALTLLAGQVKVHSVILVLVGDKCSLFLELQNRQLE